jgi:hypothetical protein
VVTQFVKTKAKREGKKKGEKGKETEFLRSRSRTKQIQNRGPWTFLGWKVMMVL